MTRQRLPRLLAFAFALAACGGGTAGATIPDPRFSTAEAVVVGSAQVHVVAPGEPNAPLDYRVVLRDVNNAPLVGLPAVLRFVDPALRLYGSQAAGTTVDCAQRRLTRLTDANGLAAFAPRFGGYANTNGIEVWKGEIELIATVRARSVDIDGADARVGLPDFALFTQRFLYDTAAPETDFDGNGSTGLQDFVLFSREFLSGAQGAFCP